MKTVTISLNAFFQPSESSVLSALRAQLPALSITAVERALFSGRYAVTFEATGYDDSALTRMFLSALSAMGYEGEVIKIEGGGESSSPGGIAEAARDTAQVVKSTMLPIAVILIAVVVLIYVPKPKSK